MDNIIVMKKNLLNDFINLRTLNVIWENIMDETIQWSTICIVNKECRKYKWNNLIYNKIYIILSYETNLRVLDIMRN
jgi:hypothetical protein